MTDNALVASEVNHYMRRRTQGNNEMVGLKIDISKAYNQIEWAFIQHRMPRFSFHETWIDRVMNFI